MDNKTHLMVIGMNNRVSIEIWFNDQFIGTVTPKDDGPGVRVISKYPLNTVRIASDPNCIETRLEL